MDNEEKLATLGTQDEEQQNKHTNQYVLDTTMRKKNPHITSIRYIIMGEETTRRDIRNRRVKPRPWVGVCKAFIHEATSRR